MELGISVLRRILTPILPAVPVFGRVRQAFLIGGTRPLPTTQLRM